MIKHLNLQIIGQVQGVLFRHSVKQKAEELNISGFAKNKPAGSVYIEAEGNSEALDKFVTWCHLGPPMAKVEKVEVKEGRIKNFSNFEIY